MSVSGLAFAFFLTLAAIGLIIAPLLRPARTLDDPHASRREKLRLRYEQAVRNVRDLDEDHALGKIADEAYAADRALWLERGVQMLKALDALPAPHAESTTAAPAPLSDADLDAAIERAVQRARQRAEAPQEGM